MREGEPVARRSASLVVALLALAILAAGAAFGPRADTRVFVDAVLAAGVLWAISMRVADPPARAIAALVASLAVVVPFRLPWQPTMALALLVYALLGQLIPTVRPSATWRARGSVPWGWTLVAGGVTPFALVAWVFAVRPDLHDVTKLYVPDLPGAVLVVAGIAFALVNAALEELVWRGVLQDRLEPIVGPRLAIVLQALSFGAQHAHGVPRGVVGMALAGVWALMLGALRRRSGGLLAPFLAHVVADAAIAVIVLVLAH